MAVWTSSNPLIRRVRRHSAMATLFRSQASETRPAPAAYSPVVMGRPFAQMSVTSEMGAPATSLPEEMIATPPMGEQPGSAFTMPQIAPQNLPQSSAAPVQPQLSSSQSLVARTVAPELESASTVAPALPFTGSAATVGLANTPASITPSSITPAPAPTPSTPAVSQQVMAKLETPAVPSQAPDPAQTPMSEEDRTWQRLQNIRRAHEQRVNPSSAAQQLSSATVQRSSEGTAHAPAAIEQVASLPQRETPVSPAPTQPAGAAPLVQRQPAAPAGSQAGLQMGSQTGAQTGSFVFADGMANTESASESSGPLRAELAAETGEDTGDDASQQRLPLEAAWPVQMAEAASPGDHHATSPVPQSRNVVQASADVDEASHRILHESVNQKLRSIESGQPTESAVDILAPRRPRPMRRPETIEQSAGVPSVPPPSAASAPPVQRQLEASPTVESPVESVVASPANQPRSTLEPTLVPTEVGPLPSDLWSLVGASPPTASQPARAADAPPPQLPSSSLPASSMPTLSAGTSAVPSPASPSTSGVIQRAGDDGAQAGDGQTGNEKVNDEQVNNEQVIEAQVGGAQPQTDAGDSSVQATIQRAVEVEVSPIESLPAESLPVETPAAEPLMAEPVMGTEAASQPSPSASASSAANMVQRASEVESAVTEPPIASQPEHAQADMSQVAGSQVPQAANASPAPGLVQRASDNMQSPTAAPSSVDDVPTAQEGESLPVISQPQAGAAPVMLSTEATAESASTSAQSIEPAPANSSGSKSKRRKSAQAAAPAATTAVQRATMPEPPLLSAPPLPEASDEPRAVVPDEEVTPAQPSGDDTGNANQAATERPVSHEESAAPAPPIQLKPAAATTASVSDTEKDTEKTRQHSTASPVAATSNGTPTLGSAPVVQRAETGDSATSRTATATSFGRVPEAVVPAQIITSSPAPARQAQAALVPQVASVMGEMGEASSAVVQRTSADPQQPVPQPVPAPQPTHSVQSVTIQADQAIAAAERPAQPQAEADSRSTAPSTNGALVQLEADGEAGGAAPANGDASPEKGAEKGDAPKVDTDELARQVYGQIKRKLALEGERMRLGRS